MYQTTFTIKAVLRVYQPSPRSQLALFVQDKFDTIDSCAICKTYLLTLGRVTSIFTHAPSQLALCVRDNSLSYADRPGIPTQLSLATHVLRKITDKVELLVYVYQPCPPS